MYSIDNGMVEVERWDDVLAPENVHFLVWLSVAYPTTTLHEGTLSRCVSFFW